MTHSSTLARFVGGIGFLLLAIVGVLVGHSDAAEPMHAYLRSEQVSHYSIEAGPRAFVRRVACGTADDQCRLARLQTYHHLPEKAEYPVRTKEAGLQCWTVWPAERVIPPGVPPRSVGRHKLTPEFLCMRLDVNEFFESTVLLINSSTANQGAELKTADPNAKFARDYPISAMFRSRYADIGVFDGAPSESSSYPFDPYSAKFADWAKTVQGELNRFASYDLLANQEGGCRLFLVMEGSDNRRYILPSSKERRMYELEVVQSPMKYQPWTWRVVDHYPSEFVNRFMVVNSNDGQWFVTGDGELHRLVINDDDKAVRRVAVRDDQRIQVLLEEPGSPDRCFAFAEQSWFALKEPLEYHEFALGPLKEDAPMPALLRCAQEVRKHYPALLTKGD